jgi:WD40 repeat protein
MVLVAAMLVAVAAALASVAANAATGSPVTWWPSLLPSMNDHYLWWLLASAMIGAGCGLSLWWAQRRYETALVALTPVAQLPQGWVVDRPEVLNTLVAALRRGGGTVGVTTAVHGAGGFGKTTVARLVRCDRRVLRRFDRRVYWVTLGRDVRRGALVEKVNDLVKQIEPGQAQSFVDVRQAAEHLAAVLADGPRRLLILDDVWFEDQLAAFPVAGRCVRLVTTRLPSLLAGQAVPVKVDQMSLEQARRVLTADLPASLPPGLLGALLRKTGRWPLLLRLVNRALLDQARSRTDIAAAGRDLLHHLHRGGPQHVDELTGTAGHALDVDDPDQRAHAVAATIEASTGLLSSDEQGRLTELAIFAEDEIIPVTLVAALWAARAGLSEVGSRALCARLASLALVELNATSDGGTLSMHDVLRDYLHHQLGEQVAEIHRALLDTVAAGLPEVSGVGDDTGEVVAWWQLPDDARYLREHLIDHLSGAGLDADAEALAIDLRWVQSRLHEAGPLGPLADLARIRTPRAARLGRLVGQTAHLLTPTDPPYSLTDILYSRVAQDDDWGPQIQALTRFRAVPALTATQPLPDLFDATTRRTLAGHTGKVNAVAIAPDGTWLATTGHDGTVRIWDAVTGAQRMKLKGYAVLGMWKVAVAPMALAIAPDGTWLATAGPNKAVRIWDAVTGAQSMVLAGHTRWVNAVAIAPDGTWLASAGEDGTVRVWDAVTGAQRMKVTGHTRWVNAVAIAPDGTWLATAGQDSTVRIFDAATGRQQVEFTGHTSTVNAVAIAPDGTWLATASDDHTVRIWDPVTATQRAQLTGHPSTVNAVAIAPDGSWRATAGGRDTTVRIWDAVTTRQRMKLTGHTHRVKAVAIAPDGTWLATAGGVDTTVRIWDAVTGAQRVKVTGYSEWDWAGAVAIAPDGTWLATVFGQRVQIWDAATGTQRAHLIKPIRKVRLAGDGTMILPAQGVIESEGAKGIAIAPDGTWLATVDGVDGGVRIWDTATATHRVELVAPGNAGGALAIAPDGTWLASGHGRTVFIWDTDSFTRRARLSGHGGTVSAVAIAPDGAWLATTSHDQTIRIWNASNYTCAATMRVDKPLHCITWGPHGHHLTVGGEAGLYHFVFDPSAAAVHDR